MTRSPRHVAALLLAAVLAVCAAACQPTAEQRAREVEARLEAFLSAVRTGHDGFGWNLLQEDVRAAYPGGASAWIEAIREFDTSVLSWTISDVDGDDFVGCANVDFGRSREAVPFTLYDDSLPGPARVAATLERGPFHMCVTVGPLPWQAGVHGVG